MRLWTVGILLATVWLSNAAHAEEKDELCELTEYQTIVLNNHFQRDHSKPVWYFDWEVVSPITITAIDEQTDEEEGGADAARCAACFTVCTGTAGQARLCLLSFTHKLST